MHMFYCAVILSDLCLSSQLQALNMSQLNLCIMTSDGREIVIGKFSVAILSGQNSWTVSVGKVRKNILESFV